MNNISNFFLRKLALSITDKCKHDCDFCYAKSTKENNSFMNKENIFNLVTEIKMTNSMIQFPLGGGEPTEHPDILEIIDFFERNNVLYSITTNGMNSHIVKHIKKGSVWVSIHNEDEITLIDKYYSMGIKNLGFNVLVDRNRLSYIYNIVSKITNKGCSFLLTFLKPYGKASNFEQDIFLTKEEKYNLIFNIAKTGIKVGTDSCLGLTKSESCECGKFWATLDSKGNLKPNSFHKNGIPLQSWTLPAFIKAYHELDKNIHNIAGNFK